MITDALYLGRFASPLTAGGFNALVAFIYTMSTADLVKRLPRRLRAEQVRSRIERARVDAHPGRPAREIQIEIDIIVQCLRRRGATDTIPAYLLAGE